MIPAEFWLLAGGLMAGATLAVLMRRRSAVRCNQQAQESVQESVQASLQESVQDSQQAMRRTTDAGLGGIKTCEGIGPARDQGTDA